MKWNWILKCISKYCVSTKRINSYRLRVPAQRFPDLTGVLPETRRERTRWFAILLDESIQGKGLGRLLMDKLKEHEQHLCGWVIEHDAYKKLDGSPYRSPLSFYLKNGFKVCDDEKFTSDQLNTIKVKWNR